MVHQKEDSTMPKATGTGPKQPDYVTVGIGATISWDSIGDARRQKLLATLAKLRKLPRERWPGKGVRLVKLDTGKELYVVRFTKTHVVFFTATEDGQFVVEDIFRQELLDRIAAQLKEEDEESP
jgi:hypothetical protein